MQYNSSLSIFWLSEHTQSNGRQGSGKTMDIPNDILLFPRSLVFNCFVHGGSTRISKVSNYIVINNALFSFANNFTHLLKKAFFYYFPHYYPFWIGFQIQ